MNEEMMALGRRAVACKGWRWMPGMVAIHPDLQASRVLFGSGYTFLGAFRRALKTKNPHWWQGWSGQVQHGQYGYAGFEHCTPVPDLSDPATLGCLLALVREAMNDEHAGVSWDLSGEEWVCDGLHVYNGTTYLGVFAQGQSYAEALVAALEAAQKAAP